MVVEQKILLAEFGLHLRLFETTITYVGSSGYSGSWDSCNPEHMGPRCGELAGDPAVQGVGGVVGAGEHCSSPPAVQILFMQALM